MADTMAIFVILIGALVGLFYLQNVDMVRQILGYYTYHKYKTKDKFYKFYDSTPLDDELIFSVLKDYNYLNNHMNYLRCHEDARPGAYDDFRIYYDHTVKWIIKRLVVVFILPSIIFFQWWYFYVIAIFAVLIISIIYEFVKNPNINKDQSENIKLLIIIDHISLKRKAKKNKKAKNKTP